MQRATSETLAAMSASKFTEPTPPTHADVWRIDAPTYTRVVDGETVTFELWASGTPQHFATVGTYARAVTIGADGAETVTYRANGGPAGWVDALPAWTVAESSSVRRGRNKRGATARVDRHGHAKRGGLTEWQLCDRARAFTLATCPDCRTVVDACETGHGGASSVDIDGAPVRDYCADCQHGCGCLPLALGMETVAYASVVPGGLSTDTRMAGIDATEQRARAALAAARTDKSRARWQRTLDRCADRRAAIVADRIGLGDTCRVAVAHADMAHGLAGWVATLPTDDARELRERHGASASGSRARRTTRRAARTRLPVPVWRKLETATVCDRLCCAIIAGGSTVRLPAPSDDTATIWHGHRLTPRPATVRTARTDAADRKRAETVPDSNETCPLPVGETETVNGVRIVRHGHADYTVTLADARRKRVRTYATAIRHAHA